MKAFKKFTYLIGFILPPFAYLGYTLGGWYNYLTPALVFLILPSRCSAPAAKADT